MCVCVCVFVLVCNLAKDKIDHYEKDFHLVWQHVHHDEMKDIEKLWLRHHAEFLPHYDLIFETGFFLLSSAYNIVIPANGREVVKTDLQIAVPDDCYGRIAPRSGLAIKHFIDVGAGVIDKDWRGEVIVVLYNFSKQDYQVRIGDRVAQLICEKISYPEIQEVPSLEDTKRGVNGYGSTGK